VTYTLFTADHGTCEYCNATNFGMSVLRTADRLTKKDLWRKFEIEVKDEGNVVSARIPIRYPEGTWRFKQDRGCCLDHTIILSSKAKTKESFVDREIKIHNLTGCWPDL
jgi:hypothetical protein